MPATGLVRSVLRGLDIVDLVARSQDGLTLGQLAARLDLKAPTVHNLARSLLARGFLAKTTRPTRYRLGGAILELAALQATRSLRHRAAAAVRHLAEGLTGATVTMAEPIGGEVVTVLRISPRRPGVLERPQQNVLPAYTSVSALAMTAFWPTETLAAYRQRYPFEVYGLALWQTPDRLAAYLAEVRRLGYAALPATSFGPQRVAAPVFSDTHELLGTLGVALHAEDAAGPMPTTDAIARDLVEAAQTIASAEPADERQSS